MVLYWALIYSRYLKTEAAKILNIIQRLNVIRVIRANWAVFAESALLPADMATFAFFPQAINAIFHRTQAFRKFRKEI